jgi:hypothetical protein
MPRTAKRLHRLSGAVFTMLHWPCSHSSQSSANQPPHGGGRQWGWTAVLKITARTQCCISSYLDDHQPPKGHRILRNLLTKQSP